MLGRQKMMCFAGCLLGCVIAVIAVAFFGNRRMYASGETHPGLESYTPTRIEWLEVQASMTLKEDRDAGIPRGRATFHPRCQD